MSGGFILDNKFENNSANIHRINVSLDYGRMKGQSQMNGYRINYSYLEYLSTIRQYELVGFRRYYNFFNKLKTQNRLGYFLETYTSALVSPNTSIFYRMGLGVAPCVYYSLSDHFTLEYTVGYMQVGYGFGYSGDRQVSVDSKFNILGSNIVLRYFF